MNFVKYQPQIYNGTGFGKYDFYTYLGQNQFQKYDAYVASENQARNEIILLVTTTNTNIALPCYYDFNCTVDWGDGSINNYIHPTQSSVGHIYQTNGTYIIKITGYINEFDIQKSWTDSITAVGNLRTSLREIIYLGDVGAKKINFYGCINLTKIHEINAPQTLDISSLLHSCINLPSLPSGIFDSFINVISIRGMFYGRSNMPSLPSGLFNNMTKVEDASYLFYYCNNLPQFPEGIFDSFINVTSIEAMFGEIINLPSLPSGLFNNMVKVQNIRSLFFKCNLTSIPSGLFDSFINVTNSQTVFRLCAGLTSIPSGLFNNMNKVIWAESMFSDCTNLTSIPSGLFDNMNKVERFNDMFNNCGKLTGSAPELWNRTNPTPIGDRCFRGCINLSNYTQIPLTWK